MQFSTTSLANDVAAANDALAASKLSSYVRYAQYLARLCNSAKLRVSVSLRSELGLSLSMPFFFAGSVARSVFAAMMLTKADVLAVIVF